MAAGYAAHIRYGASAGRALDALGELVALGDPYARIEADLLLRETALLLETAVESLVALVGSAGDSSEAWRALVEDLRARLADSRAADARATFAELHAATGVHRRLAAALSHVAGLADAAGDPSSDGLARAFELARRSPPEDVNTVVFEQIRESDVRRLAETTVDTLSLELASRVLGRPPREVELARSALRGAPPAGRWTDLDWGDE